MSRTGGFIAATAFVAVGAVAVVWGPEVIDRFTDEPISNRCTVSLDSGAYSLASDQANNTAIIATVGRAYGYDHVGVTVALATAIQESSLRNLDYGDRDSVGLFQQRTSQGWGTIEQIMDPRYSAAMFYLELNKIDGWQDLPLTEAAQAVQRSGFPDAYAAHEAEARIWAQALAGIEGVVSCELSDPAVTTAQAFSERVEADFPEAGYAVEVLGYEDNLTVLGIRPPDTSDQSLRSLEAWVIATASTTGVAWSDLHGSLWERDGNRAEGDPVPEWADYEGIRLAIVTS
jgi:hypothetical protein